MDTEKLDSGKNYYRRWTGLDITIIVVGIILLSLGYTTLIGIVLFAVYPFCLKTVVVSETKNTEKKIKATKNDWKEYRTENNISVFKQYSKTNSVSKDDKNIKNDVVDKTAIQKNDDDIKKTDTSDEDEYPKLREQFKNDHAERYLDLKFDNKTKQILIARKLLTDYRLYNFSDVINYKENVVGSHISKHHRVARGLAGGALLGGAGMVAGALTGGKDYDAVSRLSISIFFKDGTTYEDVFLKGDTKTEGIIYNVAIKGMNSLIGKLESILVENNSVANDKAQPKEMSENAQKLRDLKALLDDGVITNEDFEARKKQLLNL